MSNCSHVDVCLGAYPQFEISEGLYEQVILRGGVDIWDNQPIIFVWYRRYISLIHQIY